jgi:TRAP-type mannitol/chloroaromatic compound transport system permease small subunit
MQVVLRFAERQLEQVGRVLSWIVVPLMLVVVYEVICRYVFNSPHSWSMDIISWLMAGHFMLLSGYTLLHDGHIRMDLVYGRLTKKWKAVADIVGYCLLFLPFVTAMLWATAVLTKSAWSYKEMTTTSPQLPIYAVKTVAPVAMVLLLVTGIVGVLRAVWVLRRGEES